MPAVVSYRGSSVPLDHHEAQPKLHGWQAWWRGHAVERRTELVKCRALEDLSIEQCLGEAHHVGCRADGVTCWTAFEWLQMRMGTGWAA